MLITGELHDESMVSYFAKGTSFSSLGFGCLSHQCKYPGICPTRNSFQVQRHPNPAYPLHIS